MLLIVARLNSNGSNVLASSHYCLYYVMYLIDTNRVVKIPLFDKKYKQLGFVIKWIPLFGIFLISKQPLRMDNSVSKLFVPR